MRYFIAGGGCYGSYYVRQLDRARALGKISATEIVVVDRNPQCAVSKTLDSIAGARLVVCDWLEFGKQVWEHQKEWANDMWVPTPIGPHILYHWVANQGGIRSGALAHAPYQGVVPPLAYAQVIGEGTLVLSHAPGVCPVNCVEPLICPLTKDHRDWEMKDTVRELVQEQKASHLIDDVAVFVCHHHSHGVGTIPMTSIYEEWNRIYQRLSSGARRVAVATVSSCHGILDVMEKR